MEASPPLRIFLHIPKTAGLTLRKHILARQYVPAQAAESGWHKARHADGLRSVGVVADESGAIGLFNAVSEEGVVWYPDSVEVAAERFLRLPAELRAGVRLYYGKHIEYGLHQYLHQPVEYFTLLRHPVERVLSHYYFSQGRRAGPQGVSLNEDIRAHVEENLQTRLLAGASPSGSSPAERLERARHNLRACALVGLTERFDESLLLMRKTFGWRLPFYARTNVGHNRPPQATLPPDALGQIAADNALDMALYAEAQEIFESQVQAYGPAALAREVRFFRLLNAFWQGWYAQREAWQAGIIERPYRTLARSGVLRHWLPGRFRPRLAAAVEDNTVYFDLRVGERIVGSYDPRCGRWTLQRPYHLFVDERTLPGVIAPRPQDHP